MISDADSFEGFTPDLFQKRRERLLDALEGDVLVLPSAPVARRSGDSEYRYRPSSELFYLTGFTEPGAVAVFRRREEAPDFLLFVQPKDARAERWSGPRLGPSRAAERHGAEAHSVAELESSFSGLVADAEQIHYRLGSDARCDRLVLAELERGRARVARKGTGPRGVTDPGRILDEMRLLKDHEEVEQIRRAAAVTVAGFRAAMVEARPGIGEWEIEAALESTFRRRGARGPAFATIAGSGGNACVLHYVENHDTVGPHDLVLLDGGAEVGLYAGDVSRTFPASGRFLPEQRAIYEIVLEAHGAALAAIAPGKTLAGVHDAATRVLVEGLVRLGVLEGETDGLLERKAHQAYYPHRTSHWLGLDVHDVGDYVRDGRPRVLEPGMVLTVEPGLYFPPGGDEDRSAEYEGIGIRIEDDVLVTEEGMENLTEELPVDVDGVEALVGGTL